VVGEDLKFAFVCWADCSNSAYNIHKAIQRFTKHESFHVKIKGKIARRYGFPADNYLTNRNLKRIQDEIYDSDVIVFKNLACIQKYRLDAEKLKSKTIIGLLGGIVLDEKKRNKAIRRFEKLNAKLAVLCLGYRKFLDFPWIPRCVDVDGLRRSYDFGKLNPPLICASPSNDTDRFRRVSEMLHNAIGRLKEFRFQTDFIRNVSYDECLKRKAHASIFFDRVGSGYGTCSLEASAFESAVICGIPKFTREALNGECPFIQVDNAEDLKRVLTDLLSDESYLNKKREECLRFVYKWHDGRETVKRLLKLV